MKAKHTTGEWTLRRGINDIRSKDNYIIAQIGSANNNDEEAEANAKLIAASPELLKQLKTALWILEQNEITQGQDQIRNAIKRAVAL